MKTKNNVQKTILNTFAVLTSVILLSFSVNAQSFWKTILENNSFNEIAMVMVDSKSESAFSGGSSNHSNFADFMVNESEESLELESWMTDDSYFDSNTFYMEKETLTDIAKRWNKSRQYITSIFNRECAPKPMMLANIRLYDPIEADAWLESQNVSVAPHPSSLQYNNQ